MGENLLLGNICHKFKVDMLADYQYISKKNFETYLLGIPQGKRETIDNKIQEMLTGNVPIVQQNCIQKSITIYDIIKQNTVDIVVEKSELVYGNDNVTKNIVDDIDKQLDKENVLLDISFLQGPDPIGSNYIDIEQNTDEWKELRKFKITGSRLPALLGLYGSKKFTTYWDIVKNETQKRHARD